MTHDLFAFQERGHGWLRLLGDLGIGGILADDMGLGKTVQAIAMLVSERADGRTPGLMVRAAVVDLTIQDVRCPGSKKATSSSMAAIPITSTTFAGPRDSRPREFTMWTSAPAAASGAWSEATA